MIMTPSAVAAPPRFMTADATSQRIRTARGARPTLAMWSATSGSSWTIRAPNTRPASTCSIRTVSASPSTNGATQQAPPLLLVHGGMDFARTYDVFAPKLAAGGWRVVSWDHRGHGDSAHTELYSWDADMRDSLAVFDHVSPGRPLPVIGHSKGGALMTQLADAQSFRFTHLVNLDGIPYTRRTPDIAEHERSKMMADEIAGWLEPPPHHLDGDAPTGHARRARRTAGADEPAAPARLVAPPGDGRRVRVRRRVALEDRRRDALRRVRPVATGVDADAPARPADAVPRDPRHRERGDELGDADRQGASVHADVRPLRGARTTPATSSTSSSPTSSARWCSSSWRSSA